MNDTSKTTESLEEDLRRRFKEAKMNEEDVKNELKMKEAIAQKKMRRIRPHRCYRHLDYLANDLVNLRFSSFSTFGGLFKCLISSPPQQQQNESTKIKQEEG